jgi:hypothetical protein
MPVFSTIDSTGNRHREAIEDALVGATDWHYMTDYGKQQEYLISTRKTTWPDDKEYFCEVFAARENGHIELVFSSQSYTRSKSAEDEGVQFVKDVIAGNLTAESEAPEVEKTHYTLQAATLRAVATTLEQTLTTVDLAASREFTSPQYSHMTMRDLRDVREAVETAVARIGDLVSVYKKLGE